MVVDIEMERHYETPKRLKAGRVPERQPAGRNAPLKYTSSVPYVSPVEEARYVARLLAGLACPRPGV